MNLRRFVTASALTASLLLFSQPTFAAPPASGTEDSLAVRYAQAQLRQAELTLQKARQINQKVARTLSDAVMDQFAADVEFAKVHVQNVTRSGQVDSYQDMMTRLELNLRAAEQRMKAVARENQLAVGTVDALDIERAGAHVEVAQLQLERGKSLADASEQAKLAFQLEMLGDNLARLKGQMMVISQNRLIEF